MKDNAVCGTMNTAALFRFDYKNTEIKIMEIKTLEEIKRACEACEKCELCKTRTNVVFGTGNENARLMFIGEAPGQKEDESGIPFVGAAGKLLNKYLDAVGIAREDVYIANILKCRPPKNRDPLPAEEDMCIDYLRDHDASTG